MKKSTQFIVLGLVILALFSTVAYAQGADVAGVFQKISNVFGAFVDTFGPDVSTPAGQQSVLKWILFGILAIGLYEVLSRFMKKGTAAIVGVLVSIGIILVIPGTLLLGLFSLYGSFVTLIMIIIMLAILTYFNYLLLQVSKSWIAYASAICIWLLFIVLFTSFLGEVTNNALLLPLVFFYGLAAVIFLATKLIMTASPTGKINVGQWIDQRIDNLKKASLIVEGELENLIKKIQTFKNNPTSVTEDQMRKEFCEPVKAQLNKIIGILEAEKLKPEAAAAVATIDLALKGLKGSGSTIAWSGITLQHGNLRAWLGRYMWKQWTAMQSAGLVDTEIGGPNGVVASLKQLETMINTINKQLK
jgi:hypothetical protein